MIKIEKVDIFGWKAAIRGMRNPMNSWEKSDSVFSDVGCKDILDLNGKIVGIGELDYGVKIRLDDFNLMLKLAIAGPVEAKFRRMITVYADITAPLYWWKEFDTYKVGTVANSCSTMHKIHAKEFTLKDFSCEHLINEPFIESEPGKIQYNLQAKNMLVILIGVLNTAREMFLLTKDKKYWWQMIQLLPSSYNQKRTIMVNYEVLANIYQHRKTHKLDEWRDFCKWIETLPYSQIITLKGED